MARAEGRGGEGAAGEVVRPEGHAAQAERSLAAAASAAAAPAASAAAASAARQQGAGRGGARGPTRVDPQRNPQRPARRGQGGRKGQPRRHHEVLAQEKFLEAAARAAWSKCYWQPP